MMLPPDEVRAFLSWSSVPYVGSRTLQRVLEQARESRVGLAGLWQAPAADLVPLLPLHPRSRAALAGDRTPFWRQAERDERQLREWGVELLLASEAEFPPALDPQEFPFLFAYGGIHLTENPSAAIVSSRDASADAVAITDALADALSRRDVAIVASTNKRVYQAAATAAKRQAALTLLVVDRGLAIAFPEGLEREPVATARIWDTQFDPELQLLLSPFAWREPWKHSSGPRRDELVTKLASVLVAVDVRAEGGMDRLCRAAAARGRPVFVLDRGLETPEGSRRLWESTPGVVRLPWRGGDETALALSGALPPPESHPDPRDQGPPIEIARFLCRAALRVHPSGRPRTCASWPAGGSLARALAGQNRMESEKTAAVDCLLADLTRGEVGGPDRVRSLLDRVRSGGILAALAPAAWLADPAAAAVRAGWLEQAAPRLIARIPGTAARGEGEPESAALFLERGGSPERPPRVFSPTRPRMGRFHLRCYLREILSEFP